MDDGDVIGVLSDFLDLVLEVKTSQLGHVAFLEIVDWLCLSCPKGQNYYYNEENLEAHHLTC